MPQILSKEEKPWGAHWLEYRTVGGGGGGKDEGRKSTAVLKKKKYTPPPFLPPSFSSSLAMLSSKYFIGSTTQLSWAEADLRDI